MSLRETAVMLLLVLAGASSLVFLSETSDGVKLIANENYAVKLDTDNNTMAIGNIITIYPFPKVRVMNDEIESSEAIIGPLAAGGTVDELLISYPAGFKKDVYVTSRVKLAGKSVEQEIKVENTHSSDLKVELVLAPDTNQSYYVYLPSASPPVRYIWFSTPFNQERGMGVAAYFDTMPPNYSGPAGTSIEKGLASLKWEITVPTKQTKTIGIRYIVGYIADQALMEQHAFNPPSTKQHLLDTDGDPLFDLSNEESLREWRMAISASTAKEVIEKTGAKLDQLADTPTSETQLTSAAYNFQELIGKGQLDSLEKSLIFREMVRGKGVPAELVIGRKGESYYAWVYAYPTIDTVLYDPAGKSAQYERVYTEPGPAYCSDNVQSCDWTAGLATGVFCLLNLCGPVYLFAVVILLFFLAAFLVLQYKPEVVYRFSESIKPKSVERERSGTYEIIDRQFQPTNPLEEAVLKELEKRLGNVDLVVYEKETGFSQLLLKTTLDGLESRKIIRRL